MFIRDDLGFAWTLSGGRVHLVEDPDGGYWVDSWEEAIATLNQMGYITGGKDVEAHD